MPLNAKQQNDLIYLDSKVKQLLSEGRSDEQIFIAMGPDMPLFKSIMSSSESEMDKHCLNHTGFYHYAKILETVAQACADGKLNEFLQH